MVNLPFSIMFGTSCVNWQYGASVALNGAPFLMTGVNLVMSSRLMQK